MRSSLAALVLLALAGCQNALVNTAANVGLAAATVASPTLAPVTAPVLAARMAPTPAPTDTTAAPTTPATPTATTSAGLLPLLNQFRASEDEPPLRANASLNSAALAHAFDMSNAGFVGHTGSDGSTVGSRTRAAGCNWTSVSQAITTGQTDPAGAALAWINTPAQRRTILDDYTDFGEARVGDIWVAVFALGC